MGIRTPGLLIANETLYQLSYTPETGNGEHFTDGTRPVQVFRHPSSGAKGSFRTGSGTALGVPGQRGEGKLVTDTI